MISIDWKTFVIYIPKVDMTNIQMSPTEIWELDSNAFRLRLKDIEDDADGMGFLKTHDHNPPVDVGGVTLARVINLLPPYTVTFEDGQYAVNLIGANSNIGDRVNVNQVSVRTSNSAGLVTSAAIEFGEYGDAVTIDADNTTGKAVEGSIYPTGTLRQPSNNITDAMVIAGSRGFSTIKVLGNLTFGSTHDVDGMVIIGTSHIQNDVILEEGASCYNTVFKELEVVGILDGNNSLDSCIIGDMTYFSGHIHNCGLKGTITLAGSTASVISDCKTIDPFSPPTIDMGGSGQDLSMPNYSGLLTVQNLSSASNFAGVGLFGGTIYIDSTTVTAGTIHAAGIGQLLDGNGVRIPTGIWNGGVYITNNTVTEESIVDLVWEAPASDYSNEASMGGFLNKIKTWTNIFRKRL